jgi:DNA-binding transcriptional LysR family regulator
LQAVKALLQDDELRWDDVRVFLAVRRLGSLSAAAARLGLDVSTVSRRLTAFETAIDTRLFERTRQGLVATRAAELVAPAAEAMEAAVGRLARDASTVEASAVGSVRVSVAPGMADAFVAPALGRFRAKYPGIRLELDASVRAVDLTRHEADLALRSVRPRGADLVATKLGTARWIAMTGRALATKIERLEAWTDAPWITWDQDLASFAPSRWLSRHVPEADIALATSHFASQMVAAEAGAGLVLVPSIYRSVRKLVEVPHAPALAASAADWPVDDLWLIGHRALRDVPRVAAVWGFLLALFRGLPME